MRKKKIGKYILMTLFIIVSIILSLALLGVVVQAQGLVDETINISNEYSQYSLDNYQLDFYVDNSWGWLPWNWGDGLGKSVMYGLYAITNFIWTISLYLSNATGYLVQEAYSLDFISQTTDAIGKNMQTIAGVTKNGFSSSGFYVGFLLILILILGIYVTYTGLIKKETSKAITAVINFIVVFILSASFIAYAPDYIGKINDFSKDISNASLDVGTQIVMPNSDTQGKNSVDMIRDSLFSIQVKQPWLLLQYGSTDIASLGEERVESLVSTSPDDNGGKTREDIVIDEIEDRNNMNLTISKTISRLGMVFFLFFFNIGISIFVFLLTGIMIFSQVLFIIFAMFLPISFLLSMIPSFENMGKQAIMKLFNAIMTRAGITLIITVAFSISTMLYSLSSGSPFFMVMFLQIVTFAGIYFKLGELMSMFSLQSNDSQNMGRRFMRKPRMFFHRQTRGLKRELGKAFSRNSTPKQETGNQVNHKQAQTKANHERNNDTKSIGNRVGTTVGNMMDTKNKVVDKMQETKDNIKATPTHAKYAIHKGKHALTKNAKDFTGSITQTRESNQQQRKEQRTQNQNSLAKKRLEMDRQRQSASSSNKPPTSRPEQVPSQTSRSKHERANRQKPIHEPLPTKKSEKFDTKQRPTTTSTPPMKKIRNRGNKE
jgi:Type IV secretory pathway, VirB6 components